MSNFPENMGELQVNVDATVTVVNAYAIVSFDGVVAVVDEVDAAAVAVVVASVTVVVVVVVVVVVFSNRFISCKKSSSSASDGTGMLTHPEGKQSSSSPSYAVAT